MATNRRPKVRMTWDLWLYAIPTAFLLLVYGCGDAFDKGGWGRSGGKEARSKSISKNNLKQIGLALHNYHDVHRTFPPGGIHDKSGKGHHGWQMCLLPFVEQQQLHNQIITHVPWTDDRNARPLAETVDTYQIPYFQTETHDAQGRALSHYAGNSHIFQRNKVTRIRDIIDGTANTILVGEVSAGFKPWGDPTNYRDPALGLGTHPEKFGGPHGDRTLFLFVDGSVREIRNDVSRDVLRRLAMPADREPPPQF